MEPVVSFGQWVKQRRLTLHLTRDALAEQVCCSSELIRKLEVDARRPSTQVAERLARALALPTHLHTVFVEVARAQRRVDYLPAPDSAGISSGEALPFWGLHVFPTPLVPLLGRADDLAVVRARLLQTHMRLLTLLGPPGVGKTRLALEVAATFHDAFVDGVWFVALASVVEAHQVLPAIMLALGLREVAGQTALASLSTFLRSRRALLVLDNVEQVIQVGPQVAALLANAPQLRILVTSRILLNIQGEQIFVVPPLRVPDVTHMPALTELLDYAAVQLFVQRAQAVQSHFALTEATAATVIAICVRLDGLPLAIELAAARIRLFTPATLLARLEHPLALLTDGPRDLQPHQRALRDTIDWSYRLLSLEEQALFRCLGVFVGGSSIEAVQAVFNGAGSSELTVLNGLSALVDKSLVHHQTGSDGEPRFCLLETIREYALDCLVREGEEEEARWQHAMYYWRYAERGTRELRRPQQLSWLDQLTEDNANFRAALSWCLEQPQRIAQTAPSSHDRSVLGLRLAGALWWFWHTLTLRSEGQRWLMLALDQVSSAEPRARVRALCGAGWLSHLQDENELGMTLLEEGLVLAQSIGDVGGVAIALLALALITRKRGEYARARVQLAESLVLCEECGDHWTKAFVRFIQGLVAMDQADYGTAHLQLTEAIRWFEQCGDRTFTALPRANLGHTARLMGDFDTAAMHYNQSLALARSTHSHAAVAEVSVCVGHLARMQGDDTSAWALYHQQLITLRAFGNRRHSADCLDGLADIACRHGQAEWAAQLLGVAAGLREAIRIPVSVAEHKLYEQILRRVRDTVGEETFARAFAAGRTQNWEQIVEALPPIEALKSGKQERMVVL